MNTGNESSKEALYKMAINTYQESGSFKKVEEAKKIFRELGDYENSAEYIEKCDAYLHYQKGAHITFGNYDGKPLHWTILESNGSNCLIFCDDIPDYIPFHSEREEINWNSCKLRKWINRDFIEKAFSFRERILIMISKVDNNFDERWKAENGPDTKDKVYIFSPKELEEYFPEPEDRCNNDWWWLRGHGDSNLTQKAVYKDGTIYPQGVTTNSEGIGIRPVMRIRIPK